MAAKSLSAFSSPKGTAIVACGLVAGVALVALYFRLDPARYPFPKCPVHWLTGLHCPGCGTQRALHALLHGQVGQAVGFNLLAAFSAPVVAFGAVEAVRSYGSGSVRRHSFLYQPWFGWGVLVVTVLFTVVRNLPGPLGEWLAP